MPLFSKKRETVDEVIKRLVAADKTDDLENELRKFDPSRLSGKEKEAWHLHWGIEAFRRGDRAKAFRRFTDAAAACPDSEPIRFSLAQEYEARGEVDKMAELFRSCHFPTISSRHLLVASRYCYLWQRIDDAVSFLRPIFEAYFSLGIADDHFLYVRGLPFFGETWSYLLAYSILRRNFSEIDELTARAKAKLGDYDFDRLSLYLGCCKTEDFSPKISELERTLADADSRFPNGYQRVQLASLKSLSDPDPVLLAEVSLGPQDFPMVGRHALLIHRARIANVTANEPEEAQLIDAFVQKQPMLFEPDHAATFEFIAYQEHLKPRYQQTKAL